MILRKITVEVLKFKILTTKFKILKILKIKFKILKIKILRKTTVEELNILCWLKHSDDPEIGPKWIKPKK